MVKPELGTKRSCPSCQARFYDLNKDPIECPKCGVTFMPEMLLPAKAEQAVSKPRVLAEPEAAPKDEGVEIVGLDEVEAAEGGEDETAAVKDVDLGEDTDLETGDDTFLEQVEEDEEDVPDDLIVGNSDEEET